MVSSNMSSTRRVNSQRPPRAPRPVPDPTPFLVPDLVAELGVCPAEAGLLRGTVATASFDVNIRFNTPYCNAYGNNNFRGTFPTI
jgi:hypothetical protein